MRVSVHISTMDRASELGLLLQSLMNQSFKDFDVVMVDGSTTPSINFHFINKLVAMLKEEGHKVIYELALVKENCRQRNQCVSIDDTLNPFICRVDDDCILSNNYLESLRNLLLAGFDAASGTTPTVNCTFFKHSTKLLNVMNDIKFDVEGNITFLGDDCGFDYLTTGKTLYPAKHLRSSFMYKRSVHDAGVTYKTPGRVAFREETEFCLRMAWAGYSKFAVDINAKAFHLTCPTGGCRVQDYDAQVRSGDERFRNWAKQKFLEKGNPFPENFKEVFESKLVRNTFAGVNIIA